MKSLPAIFIVLLVIGFIVYSFTKKPEKNTAKTMYHKFEQLQGKWKILNQTTNEHYGGEDHISVVQGKSRYDYIDFKRGGTAYFKFKSTYYNCNYRLLTDSTIMFNEHVYDAKELNSASLDLHYKSTPDSNGRYSEITYWLMKR